MSQVSRFADLINLSRSSSSLNWKKACVIGFAVHLIVTFSVIILTLRIVCTSRSAAFAQMCPRKIMLHRLEWFFVLLVFAESFRTTAFVGCSAVVFNCGKSRFN